MSLKKFIHRGSTKDVFLFGDRYLFKFSDRYSVFDWGEMPDLLLGKGEALARFAKAIFHRLGEEGIKHHLISNEGMPDELIVRPFEVVRDDSSLRGRGNIFLPLEVIFRLGVARG